MSKIQTTNWCVNCEKLQKELDNIRKEVFQDFIKARGVECPCQKCSGLGTRIYADGSTWRNQPSTQKKTVDVCNICWGTGDSKRIGTNLSKLV